MRVRSSAAIALALGMAPASAQDASFGCKVLLCAAAVNPSWSGIPYCVPVMTQLFKQLARGKPWPICSEGNAGGLGYEPYEDCPKGSVPASNNPASESGGGLQIGDQNGAYCAKPNQIGSCNENDKACTSDYILTDRVPRVDPNYVDITYGGQTTRFRFNLKGY